MNTTETKSEISKAPKRSWRKHSDEFKARVIEQALQPHASLASVALENGINANMLRNWVHASSSACGLITASRDERNNPALSFVQLPMQVDQAKATPAASVTSPVVEVQIQRGETRVVVSLPLITDSAAWVAKFMDHLPLYRQEHIFERAGMVIARSTLAQWVGECGAQLQPLVEALADELRRHVVLHADETPVAMLKPGKGKTHKAYIWSYCTPSTNPVKAVVFEFCETRSGKNVRDFLKLETDQAWKGTLVTDGFSGYAGCVEKGVTSAQCMAHARRKFHELWVHHSSEVGKQALRFYQSLFRIEREIEEKTSDERRRIRQRKSRRILAVFHRWLIARRQLVPPGSATIKAIDYSLKRWAELTRFVSDGEVPISNNWVENQIRPIALGRSNWLFAGSLRAGKRGAAIMSLLHSARINGHDPYAYFKDVLERLPTHPASRINDLLPHRWAGSMAENAYTAV